MAQPLKRAEATLRIYPLPPLLTQKARSRSEKKGGRKEKPYGRTVTRLDSPAEYAAAARFRGTPKEHTSRVMEETTLHDRDAPPGTEGKRGGARAAEREDKKEERCIPTMNLRGPPARGRESYEERWPRR